MGVYFLLFAILIVIALLVLRRYFILRLRSDFWVLLGTLVGLPPALLALRLLDTEFTSGKVVALLLLLFPAVIGVCLGTYGGYLRTVVEKGYWERLYQRFGVVRLALGLVPRDAVNQMSSAVPRYVVDWKRVLLFSLLALPVWYLASVLVTRSSEMPLAFYLCFYAIYFAMGIYGLSLRPEEKKTGESRD